MESARAPKRLHGLADTAIIFTTALLLAVLCWRVALTMVAAPPQARLLFPEATREQPQGYLLVVGTPPPTLRSVLPTRVTAWPRQGTRLGMRLGSLGYIRGPVGLTIDSEGHVVRIESLRTSVKWLVVSPAGELVGSLLLPVDWRPLDIRGDRMLVRERDADGIERVSLRRVVK